MTMNIKSNIAARHIEIKVLADRAAQARHQVTVDEAANLAPAAREQARTRTGAAMVVYGD